jgi:elongation factor G
VRSIVVLGPPGAGKTSLVERLAGPRTGLPGSLGVAWSGDIAFLDPPGHPDLGGWVTAALRAADAALFVVPSGVGLSPMTVELWHRCADLGLPRLVAVSHLDAAGADLDETVALCDRLFGDDVVPSHLPLYAGEPGRPGAPVGVLDLVSGVLRDYGGDQPSVRPADREHLELIADARADLLDAVTSASADDELFDAYLAGDPEPDDLRRALAAAVADGTVHPLVPVVPVTGVGCVELLDLVAAVAAALRVAAAPSAREDGRAMAPLSADPDGPLVAELLARLPVTSLVRVFSGTLRSGEIAAAGCDAPVHVHVDDAGGPGAIVPVRGLDDVRVGETLSAPAARLSLRPAQREAGAAFPFGPVDELALTALWLDDPSLVRDAGGALWCVGPEHAAVTLARLRTLAPDAVMRDIVASGASDRPVALRLTVPPAALGAVTRRLQADSVRADSSEKDPSGGTRLAITLPVSRLRAFVADVRAVSDGTVSIERTAPEPD